MDVDVNTEGLLEVMARPPSRCTIVLVELVRKLNLGDVVRRKKSDFVYHAGETSSCVGAPREAEQTNLIALMVRLHQKHVGVFDMLHWKSVLSLAYRIARLTDHSQTTPNGHVHSSIDTIA